MPEREGTLWVINYLSGQLSTALPIFYNFPTFQNFKGKIKKKKKRLAFQEDNHSGPTAVAERIHTALLKANGSFHLSLGKK